MPEGTALRLKRPHILFLIALVVLVVGLWYWQYAKTQQAIKDEVGSTASAVLTTTEEESYRELSGEVFDFSEVRGRPRVVTLWASWSPLSKDDIAVLNAVAPAYETSEVSFVLLNRSEQPARAEAYLSQFEVTERVTVVIDADDRFYSAVEGFAMPETVIFDAKGEIYTRVRGPLSQEALKTTLDKLLSLEE